MEFEKFPLTMGKFSYIMIERAVGDSMPMQPQTAMNREIAGFAPGNFRGVCPIIGRLRRILYVA